MPRDPVAEMRKRVRKKSAPEEVGYVVVPPHGSLLSLIGRVVSSREEGAVCIAAGPSRSVAAAMAYLQPTEKRSVASYCVAARSRAATSLRDGGVARPAA